MKKVLLTLAAMAIATVSALAGSMTFTFTGENLSTSSPAAMSTDLKSLVSCNQEGVVTDVTATTIKNWGQDAYGFYKAATGGLGFTSGGQNCSMTIKLDKSYTITSFVAQAGGINISKDLRELLINGVTPKTVNDWGDEVSLASKSFANETTLLPFSYTYETPITTDEIVISGYRFQIVTLTVNYDGGDVPVQYYSVNGAVKDEENNAVEGATVTLGDMTATSASDGSFSFTDVASGDYTLTISKDGYTDVTETVTVDADKNLGDITLSTVVTTFRVTVGKSSGPVIEGAKVELFNSTGLLIETQTTNEYGDVYFYLKGALENPYTYTVTAEGMQSKTSETTLVYGGDAKTNWRMPRLDPIEPAVVNVTVTKDGQPYEGAKCYLYDVDYKYNTTVVAQDSGVTDDEGKISFSLNSTLYNPYTLRVTAEGCKEELKEFELVAGQTEEVNVELTDITYTFSVKVETGEGEATTPVSGATVEVYEGENLAYTATEVAGEEGTYTVAETITALAVSGKEYTLKVSKEGYDAYTSEPFYILGDVDKTVTLTEVVAVVGLEVPYQSNIVLPAGESAVFAEGWNTIDVDGNSNGLNGGWVPRATGSEPKIYGALYDYLRNDPANDYLISPGFSLKEGVEYAIKFHTKAGNSNEKLKVLLTKGSSLAAMTSGTQIADYNPIAYDPTVTGDQWLEPEIKFSVEEDGVYNIAFHAYSNAFEYDIWVYGFSIGEGEVAPEKLPSEISVTSDDVSYTFGEEWVSPVVNPHNLPLSISLMGDSDDAVVLVDNDVVPVKAFAGYVTVTFEGNDEYEVGGSKFYLTASKGEANLSFPEAEYTADWGMEWPDAPELINPNNLTVTWSSSDSYVANVNSVTGEINPWGDGEAEIKATFAGNDQFNAGEASYTLTVVGPQSDLVTPELTLEESKFIMDGEITFNEDEYLFLVSGTTSLDKVKVNVTPVEPYNCYVWLSMGGVGEASRRKVEAPDTEYWPTKEQLEEVMADYDLVFNEPIEISTQSDDLIVLFLGIDGKYYADECYNVAHNLVYDQTVSVEGIEAVDEDAMYFTLQGMRVAKPGEGIYLKVTAGKAVKVLRK